MNESVKCGNAVESASHVAARRASCGQCLGTLLLGLLLLSWGWPALAGIDCGYDWDGSDRVLKVWYNFDTVNDKLGDQTLKDIMDAALQEWNDCKDDTGWEFMGGGTAGDHDIEIKVDANLNRSGGAETTGFPSAGDRDRTVSELTITFDPSPKAGAKDIEWDEAGKPKDDTKNPLGTAIHELSHTLRLDHQGGRRSTTMKIKDPQGAVTKDDDVTSLSQDDKDEAKTASTKPITVAGGAAGPGGGDLSLNTPGFPFGIPFTPNTLDMTLFAPEAAFQNDVFVEISRTSMYSMPLPFDAPAGIDRMVKGMHIDVTAVVGVPLLGSELVTVTIPYEDGVEGEGFLVELRDPDLGSVVEADLRPFYYDPTLQEWLDLQQSFFVDMTADVVTITFPASMLYLFPEAGAPEAGTLFLAISGPTRVVLPGLTEWSAAALVALIALAGGVVLVRRTRSDPAAV